MDRTAWQQALRQLLPPGQCLTEPAECWAYGYDNSRKQMPPEAVVLPTSTAQVAAVLTLCCAHGVPVTPRGRGTGTAGGAIPARGGVALSLERMNRILGVEPENRLAVVEAGVLNGDLQQALRHAELFWPPDPSSAAYCSIGGNLATNAGGPHAVKYGTSRDHVLGLTAVTGDGTIVHTGTRTTKSSVAYDLTRLLVGSEGTLAVITEATLRLLPRPAATAGMCAQFASSDAGAACVAAIMASPVVPSALELLDEGALSLLRQHHPGLISPAARALLMIEVDGVAAALPEQQAQLGALCQDHEVLQLEQMDDPARLWAARKALSPLLRDLAPKKINEDVVVPVSQLPALLQALDRMRQQYGLTIVNFGHAGNGNIHVNLLLDPKDTLLAARADACLSDVFSTVLALGGTISGEHGVGQDKAPFVAAAVDQAALALMRQIKTVFDPAGILNPGKIFPDR